MVAPPWFSIPPEGYGGIESMVHSLTEELTARGHEVILIAAGQADTAAPVLETYEEPLGGERLGQAFPEVVHSLEAAAKLDGLEVDVVHDHTVAGPLAAAGRSAPTVVTAHSPVDGEIGRYYRGLPPEVGLVAISDAQRAMAPQLNWLATVHNAIPVKDYPLQTEKEDFVLFLGRVSGEKAPDLAIQAARAAGRHLVAAAKCSEPAEREYFQAKVQPLLGPDVDWVGEVDDDAKKRLLARASALVFPIQWEEPFGIVMVEAMACGTPVVALRRGSVPEVIVDQQTGFICDDLAELPAALQRVGELDPMRCRRHVEERFSVAPMTDGYEAVYRAVADPVE
jgi:glycosyltransferase involved in cell wall biosynthesis